MLRDLYPLNLLPKRGSVARSVFTGDADFCVDVSDLSLPPNFLSEKKKKAGVLTLSALRHFQRLVKGNRYVGSVDTGVGCWWWRENFECVVARDASLGAGRTWGRGASLLGGIYGWGNLWGGVKRTWGNGEWEGVGVRGWSERAGEGS